MSGSTNFASLKKKEKKHKKKPPGLEEHFELRSTRLSLNKVFCCYHFFIVICYPPRLVLTLFFISIFGDTKSVNKFVKHNIAFTLLLHRLTTGICAFQFQIIDDYSDYVRLLTRFIEIGGKLCSSNRFEVEHCNAASIQLT